MPVSREFRSFALDQLRRVIPNLRDRAMFGGVGIYAGEMFFALIADDVLYLKVDDSNRAMFTGRGSGPFRPYGPDGEIMQYYELPADVLEDADALREWTAAAIDVARNKKRKHR